MIETSVSWITLLEPDVLRIEYKSDCFVDVEELNENLAAYRRLMTTEKVYLLTIANAGAEASPAVRDVFASKERSSWKIAEAFVISSMAQRIVANFVLRVQKPSHILRFFTNENDAREWLYAQRDRISKSNSPGKVRV
jgi:hypothetical protein